MRIVNPHIWSKNFEIIGRNYGNPMKIKFNEASIINELKPSLNQQSKPFPLKLFN